MPSGLTHKIYEGTDLSLANFARTCAAQFFHDCSEVPSEKALEEMFGINHIKENIAEVEAETAALALMTDEQVAALNVKEEAEVVKRFNDNVRTAEQRATWYGKVLEELDVWNPPEELKGLKDLCTRMLAQDEQDWRMPDERYYKFKYRSKNDRIKELREDVTRLDENLLEAMKQVNERAAFIKALEREFPR